MTPISAEGSGEKVCVNERKWSLAETEKLEVTHRQTGTERKESWEFLAVFAGCVEAILGTGCSLVDPLLVGATACFH